MPQGMPAPRTEQLTQTLSQENLRRTILLLAWPVMAEMALGTVTQIVDMAMVGRLGSASIAAIGMSMQPFMLAFSIFSAISVGNTALVARFIGSKDPDSASRTLAQSLLIGITMAALIGVGGFVFARQIISIMGPEPEVLDLGVSYVRYMLPGFFFMFSGMMITGSLRGAGDTKTPMKINIAINLLNPLLNYVLIFGHFGFPAMGVRGAALATTLARSLGGVCFAIIVLRGKGILHLKLQDLKQLDTPLIKRILNIGIPAAIEQLVSRTGQMLYARTVAGLGTVMYAAHSIAINAESISYMPGFGFATAATALVGQSLGATDPERASKAGWESWRLGSLLMGFMGVLLFLIPGVLMRIYTDDPEVISYGITALRIAAFAQIPMATGFIFAGALRGAGDTRFMLYISTAGVWIVRLGLAYIFVSVLGWGLAGAWVAMSADWLFRGGMAALRFKTDKWKRIKV